MMTEERTQERIEERRRELNRMAKGDLAILLVRGVPTADGGWLSNAGPVSQVMRWQKSEIINDLLDMERRAAR